MSMKRLDRSVRPGAGVLGRIDLAPTEATLTLAEMGARGEAVAKGNDGPLFVPYALPGETVRARLHSSRAELLAIAKPSAERVAPPCAHFGRCGGCQLQHWAAPPYLAWKRREVVRALERRRIDIQPDETIVAWGAGRRRAAFHAQRSGRQVRFGFVERGGARIEPVVTCPVLAPGLADALDKLRALANAFAPTRGELTLAALATETGLDVAIKGAGKPAGFERKRLEAAAAITEELDLARLSFDGEPLAVRRVPILTMGPAKVAPPPGAFVQATAEGERAIGLLALEAVAGAKRIADLFSGIGTLALRAAAVCEVLAVEGDAEMLAALKTAADGVGGLRGVTVERRDLLRAPLASLELKRFDAVIFDPPRAGAKLQAEQIAASKASRVAAVSCDPATFARDVRILVDAGFKLTRVTPIDQFRWTPHVEIVGALER